MSIIGWFAKGAKAPAEGKFTPKEAWRELFLSFDREIEYTRILGNYDKNLDLVLKKLIGDPGMTVGTNRVPIVKSAVKSQLMHSKQELDDLFKKVRTRWEYIDRVRREPENEPTHFILRFTERDFYSVKLLFDALLKRMDAMTAVFTVFEVKINTSLSPEQWLSIFWSACNPAREKVEEQSVIIYRFLERHA